MGKVELLDCTLRDGGYVNDWRFGHSNIVNLFERLVSSGVEYIEVGFLDERRPFDMDRTIVPDAMSMNKLLGGLDKGRSCIVGMIDYGTCSIDKLLPKEECVLDGIRVIFKKQKMRPAIEFCSQVKKLGYKVFAQAVSITSYSDDELEELIGLVNELNPHAFSLVDTYGLLHKKELMHYFEVADSRLNPAIHLGYHAHNNFQLAFANCVELVEQKDTKRDVLVDGTLYGMGKSAGNAPTELLAGYLNDNFEKSYRLNQIMEAIDVTILDIYREIPWGYAFKFYVSATHDCHPNYVTYLMNKKKLSMSSISHILNKLEGDKKLLYDQDYIDKLYLEYQQIECDDSVSFEALEKELKGKSILLLAPGKTVKSYEQKIKDYIRDVQPVCISINYIPSNIPVEYAFLSNAKRYVQQATELATKTDIKLIATSNVTRAKGDFDYVFSYSDLLDEEALIVDNPMIMLIRLLNDMKVGNIALAGFDGYEKTELPNYVNANMEHTFSKEKANEINLDVRSSLNRLPLTVRYEYITPSLYENNTGEA
ncbi:MAG: aldolase catalytic domain-containing protein [Lachnospiraceae bacterium]|nr:aldolase catalytic domain-containing protein [Lachnospiraceae bacterium]